MTQPLSPARVLAIALAAVIIVRVLSLPLYPLGDTTEARYGEVARLMLASGDWITPANDPGVPFWAKPPLSFWLQAATMAIFGVNEFGARVSSVLLAAIVGALLFILARRVQPDRPRAEAWRALLILATAPLFFVVAGAVMTDMALLATMTLSMVGFWLAWTEQARAWGYAFFAGLGLAMLAKGPVGVVLVGGSLALYWLIAPERGENLRRLWRRLPWLGGTLLALAIALPWYALAERKTPGFLQYFIVGEHFKRFTVPGWQGDMYGNAHVEPRGKIWLFFVYAVLPWLPLAVWAESARWRARRAAPERDANMADAGAAAARGALDPSAPAGLALAPRDNPAHDFDRYLLAWTLATPLFFSLAGNTIWSYVLPSMPAFALLLARRLAPGTAPARTGAFVTAAITITLFSAFFLFWLPRAEVQIARSTKAMVAAKNAAAADPAAPLYVLGQLQHSTKFYSRATARHLKDADLPALPAQAGEFFLALPADRPDLVDAARAAQVSVIGTFGDTVLLHGR